MSLHSLPVFMRLEGRRVVLVGEGAAADAKRRLLARAGALVVGEDGALPGARPSPPPGTNGQEGVPGPPVRPALAEALPFPSEGSAALRQAQGESGQDSPRLAIVVDDEAAVARLKARGILVNAVDRPDLCDFTLPAIIDRDPVIVAIGTGGASAGLAAALRQRLEALIPSRLGGLARDLFGARAALRRRWPDADARRRALARGMAPGGPLDPLGNAADVDGWLRTADDAPGVALFRIVLRSPDPDDLTLREARVLAQADRVSHAPGVPAAILDRARADAARIPCDAPPPDAPGLTVDVRCA